MTRIASQIILKSGKEDSLRRFHPWIFSGAMKRIEGKPAEGDVVDVMSADGQFLARGHWQIGSIAVRVLTFEQEEINHHFWQKRLAAALHMRRSCGIAGRVDNDTYRLVHGEGDNLPGLVVDIYGRTAVVQAHSVGMHCQRMEVTEALSQVMDNELEAVYYKSETTLPYMAALGQENGFLMGKSSTDVATENGLKFRIDWLKGQKTGFFVDQRDNRALVEHYAQGRNVLNMFCYTGGFSVYALRGGATLVHSVDCSAKAVALARDNVELNFAGCTRHEAFDQDAFRYMERMSTPYHLMILDPPAFAKHRDALKSALRGYTRLNAKAIEKIQPGGILFTFSCSQAVSPHDFRCAVFTAAQLTGRRVRILHQLHQPLDHPVNIYHPEGEYLKGLVLYVE